MKKESKSTTSLPKTVAGFFWHFIKKQPIAFAVFFMAPLSMVLENNAIPYSLKIIIDAVTKHPNETDIFSLVAPALWLGGIAWISLLLILRLTDWWQAYVIPKFQADVRMSVFNYLSRQSHHYFANQMPGTLANKINDLPRALDAIFMILTWYVVAALSSIVVALILMCTISIYFAIVLLTWVIIQLLISIILSKKVNFFSKANAEDKSCLSGKIVDSISNSHIIKLFARSAYEQTQIQKSQNLETQSNKKLTIYMNLFRIYMDIPVTIMLGTMVCLLLVFWQHHWITTGDLVFIFNVSFAIMTQIWYLCHAMADLFREVGIAKQAIDLLTVPIDVQDVKEAQDIKVHSGEIRFNNVSFHYNLGKKIFKNKSVIIPAGQKVGLVGYSGSGKSTFIHLILRLYDLESGRILIDGQDISKVTQDSLHDSITMIPQDTSLFNRSLMDNIRFGNIEATDEEVILASKKACCHDFIHLLPEGYNTIVGDRGIKLSGGQRQRIAIARALLKESKILILDEATSQLDSLTEELIQNSLWELMEGKTSIVIAHRLSTLLHMDRILVFAEGKIVEDGSHDELLQKNGLYQSMWSAQVGGLLPESDKDRDSWED